MSASRSASSKRSFVLKAIGLILLGALGYFGLRWSIDGDLGGVRQFVAVVSSALQLFVSFIVSYWLIMLVLSNRTTVCAVARSVLREAMAMKIGQVLLVLLCIVIAVAPFVIGEGDKLQYRIQQFLTYSLTVMFALLCLMTIFIACSTLSSEIEGKQIFTVMTKPVNRGKYLIGKWLGLLLLNGLLLLVGGVAIYGFAVNYLERQPAMDALDRASIRGQVFTARVAAEPRPPEDLTKAITAKARERVEYLKQNQGELYIEEQGGEEQVYQAYLEQALTEWRSLGPWQGGRDRAIFVFDNMQAARAQAQAALQRRLDAQIAGLDPTVRSRMTSDADFDRYVRSQIRNAIRAAGFEDQFVQLEYKLQANGRTPDNESRVRIGANGRWLGDPIQVPNRIRQTQMIPAELIDDNGQLAVWVRNYNPSSSISFSQKDGMELLYKVDQFLPNYVRSMLVLWFKLAFVAALGLAAATFLGFPVAVLLSLLVVVGASYSGFILESVYGYGSGARHPSTRIVQVTIRYIALAFTEPLSQFGKYRPIPNLTGGLNVSWQVVGQCAMWIGCIWTGLVGVIGGLIYRSRELARVQV